MADINIPTAITSWDIGDLLVGSAVGRSARLPGSVGPDLMVLAQKGDGKKSAKPFWSPLSGIIPGLAAIATSGSASDLIGGTVPAARFPAFTGDVTNPVGSLVTTISQKAVGNDKLAFMPPLTIKGNNSILPGAPKDLTVADLNAMGIGGGGGGSGTVTSVGLSLPAIFSVAGSPVTTAGTFTVTLATELANTVWAGPTTGAAAMPTFRGLVLADIPDLSTIYQPLDATLTALSGLADALGLLHNDGVGGLTWAAAGTGTVTSVSVISANGLAGTVATATTTPAITLSTTITGLLKGNATAISAAAAGTDYVAPGPITTDGITMSTARLLGRSTAGTGAVEEITLGTNLSFTGTTLNAAGGGGSPGGANTQIQFNDGGSFGGDADFTWDKTANLLTNAGAYASGGTLPGGTAFYIERTANAIATINSTSNDARLRLIRPDVNHGAYVEFTRNASGVFADQFYMGTPYTVATPDGSGNQFVVQYYDTTEHTFFGISTAGVVSIGSPLTSGPVLSIDALDTPIYRFRKGTTTKFSGGVAGGVNEFITGSAANDFCFKNEASGSFLFSTDNGASIGFKIAPGFIGALGASSDFTWTNGDLVTLGADNTNAAFGVKATNTDSAGRASMSAFNDVGTEGGFTIYGSANPSTPLRNKTSFYGALGLQFVSDGGVTSGGSSNMDFISGGYTNSPTFRITPGNPGTIGLLGPVVGGATFLNPTGQSRIDVKSTNNGSNSAVQFETLDSGATLRQGGLFFIPATSTANSFFTVSADASNLHLNVFGDGRIEFAAVPLTTGLSIAIATKTFPLTINGTVVNVLCQ